MAGLVLPQIEYSRDVNHQRAPSAPVIETVHAWSEHDTPDGAEKALLERYIFQQNNSSYRSNEEQVATTKENGSIVIVKRIPKAFANQARAVRKEIDLLWNIPHPIIRNMNEWLETPDMLYLVQENKPRRSLRQLVETSGPVPHDGAKDVMTQLYSGIAHLFLHHIAPMRIMPDNLLFDTSSNLVIGNFDQAVKYSEEKVHGEPYALITGKFGDDIFTAPEMFDEITYNARKAVVWNCGVVLVCRPSDAFRKQANILQYYMCTAQTDRLADLEHPSTTRNGVQAKRRYSIATKVNKDIPRIINYPNRFKVPSWAIDIISKMLIFNPLKRPELIEVAAKVPKLPGDDKSRPLMELAYLDYKYNVGPVGPPLEQLLKTGNASSASSIFAGASSLFSVNTNTGLLRWAGYTAKP